MVFSPPPVEDEDEVRRRQMAAMEQQRRIDELHQAAYDAIVKAEAAMREARRLMVFPGESVSWSEKLRRDGNE